MFLVFKICFIVIVNNGNLLLNNFIISELFVVILKENVCCVFVKVVVELLKI